MLTIQIQEDHLAKIIKQMAEEQETTVDELARAALFYYIQTQPTITKRFSFIGIGHSGKHDLSTSVEEVLAEGANRLEGWSLSE
ncbi:MAG: hypothetical protein HND44_12650 [Chloroflexi bacterium]|nr:hypothetical protein [Ardenticatenaceae bacterium]MBL1129330.1 hypothetical protein [Chloroflexota bacterium]NOG35407.1 hypothetical protein [Chloroflexota bacterium]GIK58637.1 MAG: hypothetical protein BroJett015_43000 [Chloroflexota bacterium]